MEVAKGFEAAESKARGSNMGGYDIDPSSLRPGKVKVSSGQGFTPQTEFLGKWVHAWEPEDRGWESEETQMLNIRPKGKVVN